MARRKIRCWICGESLPFSSRDYGRHMQYQHGEDDEEAALEFFVERGIPVKCPNCGDTVDAEKWEDHMLWCMGRGYYYR